MKKITKVLISLFCCVILMGCVRGIDIERDTKRFYKHQETFEALAQTGCTLRELLDTRYFSYPSELKEISPELKTSVKPYSTQFKRQLKTIKLDWVLLMSHQKEGIDCSIFVDIDSVSFAGDGFYYGYLYQPLDLGEYEYTEDIFDHEALQNQGRGEEFKFSIELENGWYLQYFSFR